MECDKIPNQVMTSIFHFVELKMEILQTAN